MSDKRKKQKSAAKREQGREKEEELRLERSVKSGRLVPADYSQQVPNNSYSDSPTFYVDVDFTCRDCGSEETWTSQQQKWYYEVAKGSLFAKAVRCRDCRRKHSEKEPGQGDPNPIKHSGSLMKRIRSEIEPRLVKAGFELAAKDYGTNFGPAWVEYARPGLALVCRFERPFVSRLTAETMNDKAECNVVASVDTSSVDSTQMLFECIEEFASAVHHFLDSLKPAPP